MVRAGGERRVPAQPCHRPVVPLPLPSLLAEPQGSGASLYRGGHPAPWQGFAFSPPRRSRDPRTQRCPQPRLPTLAALSHVNTSPLPAWAPQRRPVSGKQDLAALRDLVYLPERIWLEFFFIIFFFFFLRAGESPRRNARCLSTLTHPTARGPASPSCPPGALGAGEKPPLAR